MEIRSVTLARLLRNIRPAFMASFLKRILGSNRFYFQAKYGKFWIDPVSDVGFSILSQAEFEPYMFSTLQKYLRPGSTFVDLGANEGYFSVLAGSLVGEQGKIVSVEPQSRLQEVIQRNLELNSVATATLVQAAISDSAGELEIYLSPDVNTGSSGLFQSTRYRVPTEKVPVLSLHDLFDRFKISECDLMKVDVEGAEYEAILGSRNLFQQKRIKAIALEIHPSLLNSRGLSADEICQFLESCGYQLSHPFGYLVFEASSA